MVSTLARLLLCWSSLFHAPHAYNEDWTYDVPRPVKVVLWSNTWDMGFESTRFVDNKRGGYDYGNCTAHKAFEEFRDGVVPDDYVHDADVVFINLPSLQYDGGVPRMPRVKREGQLWVAFCHEPTVFDGVAHEAVDCSLLESKDFMALIDGVASYSNDSTYPAFFNPPPEVMMRRPVPVFAARGPALATYAYSDTRSTYRNAWLKAINASFEAKGYDGDILSYGSLFHNMAEPKCTNQSEQVQWPPGEDPNRGADRCGSRRFTLVAENTEIPWYVTEKLWNAYASGSMPVYLGTPEVKHFMPPESFLVASDFSSVDALVDEMIRISSDPKAWDRATEWKKWPVEEWGMWTHARRYSESTLGPRLCEAGAKVTLGPSQQPFPPPDLAAFWPWPLAITVLVIVVAALAVRFMPKALEVPEVLKLPGWVVLWASCSIGMTVLNKRVTSPGSGFCVGDSCFPLLVILQQMVFSTIAIGALFPWAARFDRRAALPWLVVPVLFVSMTSSSILGIAKDSLIAVTIIRNITPLWAMIAERLFWGKKPSALMVVGILMTLAGSATYVFGLGTSKTRSAEVTIAGACWLILNGVMATADRTLQRYFLAVRQINLEPVTLVLINNAVGALIMLPLSAVEISHLSTALGDHGSGGGELANGVWLVLLSGAFGVGIGYAGLQTQKRVSATAFLLLTNVNKIVIILYGVVVSKDCVTWLSGVGIGLALAGGAMYAWPKPTASTVATENQHGRQEGLISSFAEVPDGPGCAVSWN